MPSTRSTTIAKNTLFLYGRLLIVMLISLYSSRLVLEYLGVSNFGIYNVVGGIVTMLTFLRGTLAGSIQRFLAVSIGKKDPKEISKTFSISLNVQIFASLLFVIILETVGVWFLNNKMDIPSGRMIAANWVLQTSLFSVILTFCGLPYNSAIIVNEKMNIYAIFNILEVALRLFLIILLKYLRGDYLIIYAFMMLGITALTQILNFTYCRIKFKELRYKKITGLKEHYPLLKFSIWNTFGSVAVLFRGQGLNIVLNLFCGTLVNAAVGVSNQVYSAISGLTANFTMALNPQIYKSYAGGEKEYFENIIFRGAKFSFFLMFITAFPVLLEIDPILSFWLVDIPPLTSIFARIIIIIGLIDCISNPLITGALAHGEIRNYQIAIGGTILLILPCAYLALKLGAPPYSAFLISLVFSIIALGLRLLFLKKMVSFPAIGFFKSVIIRILLVVLISIPIPIILKGYLNDSLVSFISIVLISVIIVGAVSLFIGFNKSERHGVLKLIGQFVKKISGNGKCRTEN